MPKKPQPEPRHAAQNCACDRCFKPDPAAEKAAAAWWNDLYNRLGWPKDGTPYLKP